MGSDLSFEDLSNRQLNSNDYKRLEDAKWLGRDCYVLETVPKRSLNPIILDMYLG